MNAALSAGIWPALIVALISAAAAIFVGVYAARSARTATRETTQVTSWKNLTESHTTEIDRLRADRAEDRAQLLECQSRIDDLTKRFEAAERRERALILWARDVVRIMRDAKVQFPAPPPGVSDTDPDGRAPIR